MSTTLRPDRARAIMGKNFFGIEEAIRHFGVNPTRPQIVALSTIPFSDAVLKRCKNSHVLIALFPLSILEIRDRAKQTLFFSHEDAWYNDEIFAEELAEARSWLIQKTPLESSTDTNWWTQQKMIGKNAKVPSAQLMVYCVIGHFLTTGERLLKDVYVRTSTVGSGNLRVNIGHFGDDGLCIDGKSDDYIYDHLGLAVAWKSRT